MVQHYEFYNKLGEGAYGTVYKVKAQPGNLIQIPAGYEVAMKVVKYNSDGSTPLSVLQEVQTLLHIDNHPNIMKFFGVESSATHLFLVFELLDYDLGQFMDQNKGNISEDLIRSLMLDCLLGLDFLHSHHIIHRDIKPQNLLLDSCHNLRIGDFGMSCIYNHQTSGLPSEVVTQWYRCPELLLGSNSYRGKVDVWSVGCVMGELFIGIPLFFTHATSGLAQLTTIFQSRGTPVPVQSTSRLSYPHIGKLPLWNPILFPYNMIIEYDVMLLYRASPLACDLLDHLSMYNPKKRYSAAQALAHPFFQVDTAQYHHNSTPNYLLY